MKTRRFGNTGLEISPLGLGTVKFGRDRGLKHPEPFRIPGDREARELLALAADLGINLLDTAPAYGTSEERLGALLAGTRQDWVICTKVGEEFDGETGLSRFDFTPEHVRFSVERSLDRLRTDFLDIVLVHSDGNDVDIIERFGTLGALDELKAEGKTRAYGVSSKTVEGGLLTLDRADCAMVTYNPAYAEELPVLDRAAEAGKGILIKKPFASGHLAASGGTDPVAAAFELIFSHPGVSSVVVGTINPTHLRANVSACLRVLEASDRNPADPGSSARLRSSSSRRGGRGS